MDAQVVLAWRSAGRFVSGRGSRCANAFAEYSFENLDSHSLMPKQNSAWDLEHSADRRESRWLNVCEAANEIALFGTRGTLGILLGLNNTRGAAVEIASFPYRHPTKRV